MLSLLDNLVVWYRMDDNTDSVAVLDASGNAYHGTSQQNTDLMHAAGKVGGALSFDGTTDFIDIGDFVVGNDLWADSFTISFGAKPTDGYSNELRFLLLFACEYGEFYAQTTPDGNILVHPHNDFGSIVSDNIFSVTENSFRHIVIVFKKLTSTTASLLIYVDGILFKTANGTFVFSEYETGGLNCSIGNIAGGGHYALLASIDNFMVFNKALTDDEVAELYLLTGDGGYHRVYRGQDGNIDYDNAVALMTLDATDVTIPAQSLPPNTIWHYARKQVSDCGLESPASPVCVVAINDDGDMVSNTPNVPQNIIIEPLAGAKFMLRWRYLSTGQEIVPTGFRIYMDSGSGFDFNTPLATVDYRKAIEHKWTSAVLVHGQRYKFIVRSYNSVSLGESQNTGFVSALADSVGPPAATGLAIAWESQ